jgi:general secretion pathway protein M
MIETLPKPVRQALAVGLLLLAIAAVWMLTIAPLSAKLGELQDRIDQERTMLGRLVAASAEETGPADSRQKAIAARMNGLLIQGESESIRVSAVQSRLMEILASNRVKPRSTRNLTARERGGFRLVGVQLHLSAPIEQLQAVLHEIEQHKPLLFVEALHISPIVTGGGTGEEERGMLEARFDVFGVEAKQKGQ